MSAFVGRVARAMVRRAAEGDLETLSALAAMQAAIDSAIEEAALAAHDAGYSWSQVAEELSITRQAAWQRFGRKAAS